MNTVRHRRLLTLIVANLILSSLLPASIRARSFHANTSVSPRNKVAHLRQRKPGFTESERERAIERGMRFVYRSAGKTANFTQYGSDYLWWFAAISNTVRDQRVSRTAREMAVDCARRWRQAHQALPPAADVDTIEDFIAGESAVGTLGRSEDQRSDAPLKDQLRQAASKFTSEDFLDFDPRTEPPPADIPDECEYDGTDDNPRGAKFCHLCHRRLVMRTPYDVWYTALITSQMGDRYGVTLGANYSDVLKWLPTVAPYRARGRPGDQAFMDAVYAVTHIVYTLNDYWTYRLDPKLLPHEFEFLKTSLPKAIAARDADMIGEILDSLKSFGLDDSDKSVRRGAQFLLAHQHADGSWGNVHDGVYDRYHATEAAVNGLCEYKLREARLSFPEMEPMLKRWAHTEKSAK